MKNRDIKELEFDNYKPKLISDLFNYTIKHLIYSLLIAITISSFVVVTNKNYDWFGRFDLVSVLVGLIPFIPLLFIWKSIKIQQWVKSLPNYLNVTFTYNNQPEIKILSIPLIDTADIRSQAQAIGRTINKNCNLDIAPIIGNRPHTKIQIDTSKTINDGNPFELHSVSIKLQKPLTEHEIGSDYQLQDGIIHWQYPFEKEDICIQRQGKLEPLNRFKVDKH